MFFRKRVESRRMGWAHQVREYGIKVYATLRLISHQIKDERKTFSMFKIFLRICCFLDFDVEERDEV